MHYHEARPTWRHLSEMHLKPVQINAIELLSLFQEDIWPAVITKNIKLEAEDRFQYDLNKVRALNGNWAGQPVQVTSGNAFCIHFVEKKKLIYIADYLGTESCEADTKRYKLIMENVQCFFIKDWDEVGDAQKELRKILKKEGAVTYSYYFGPSDREKFQRACFRMAEVKIRLQQSAFRKAVFARYEHTCVITQCTVEALLEAAHLPGKNWQSGDNGPDDGIPLRADLHRALDAKLIRLNEKHKLVYVDPRLQSEYGQYIFRSVSN